MTRFWTLIIGIIDFFITTSACSFAFWKVDQTVEILNTFRCSWYEKKNVRSCCRNMPDNNLKTWIEKKAFLCNFKNTFLGFIEKNSSTNFWYNGEIASIYSVNTSTLTSIITDYFFPTFLVHITNIQDTLVVFQ